MGRVVWINGAFGAGKTTVAEILLVRLHRAVLLDSGDRARPAFWARPMSPAPQRPICVDDECVDDDMIRILGE